MPTPEGSNTHRALLHAEAAIEAMVRGDGQEAAHCVSRGYERINLPVPAGGVRQRLEYLIDSVYDADDGEALFAAQVRNRLRALLREKRE